MNQVTKNPQWRDAERFAERHARTVLAFVDVRVNLDPADPPTDRWTWSGRLLRTRRAPAQPGRAAEIEHLRAAAGSTVAVFYSRRGSPRSRCCTPRSTASPCSGTPTPASRPR